jgi:hypothetical protein
MYNTTNTELSSGNRYENEPVLRVAEHGHFRVHVRAIQIRHTAVYRDEKEGSVNLNIEMLRNTAITSVGEELGATGNRIRNIKALPTKRKGSVGCPNTWYEAYLTSVRAEKVFQENQQLELGDEAQWSAQDMSGEGVFSALIAASLEMVKQMDMIGSNGSNCADSERGRSPSLGQDALLAKERQRKELDEFW